MSLKTFSYSGKTQVSVMGSFSKDLGFRDGFGYLNNTTCGCGKPRKLCERK